VETNCSFLLDPLQRKMGMVEHDDTIFSPYYVTMMIPVNVCIYLQNEHDS